MRKVAGFIALAGSIGLLCEAQTPTTRPFGAGLYDVALDFSKPLRATVHATLSITDGQLFVLPRADGSQWSSDIKELQARSNDGGDVPLTFVAPNHWRFRSLASQTVRITYIVDLSFTKALHESSDRRGQLLGDALYIANPALFVLSDASGERTVHFVVPDSFTIATPLRQIAPSTYSASSNRELASNATVFEWFPRAPATDSVVHRIMPLPGSPATALSKSLDSVSFRSCTPYASEWQSLTDDCTRLDRIER